MAVIEAARACLETWQGWTVRPKVHNPFAFVQFYRPLADVAPDVMLEAKAKDVAVSQLQRDLVRYAPDLAQVFGLET